MTLKPIQSALLLLAFCAMSHVVSAQAEKPEIWLAGVDPFVRKVMYSEDQSDYQKLFVAGANWERAASQITVFKTSTQWILRAGDEDLREMFSDLRRRKVKLAMEGLMIRQTGPCGRGVEGFSGPDEIRNAMRRIRNLGGDLSFIAMDEPLFYGHEFRGPNACGMEISALAKNVAESVKIAREIFPRLQVGDIEPVSARLGSKWAIKLAEWANAYRAETGTPLAFLHLDVNWDDETYIAGIKRAHQEIGRLGIKVGIIYNGGPNDASDIEWTRHAAGRFERVESLPLLRFGDVILQTWMKFPKRMLPENELGTMTNLVLLYSRSPTVVNAKATKGTVIGSLRDINGKPIRDAKIDVYSLPHADANGLLPKEIIGNVPPKATTGVLGLRLNAECDCSGNGKLSIGSIRFAMGDLAIARQFRIAKGTGENRAVFEVDATGGTPVIENTQSFAVKEGEEFRAQFALAASPELYEGGYMALIFLDSHGKEVGRIKSSLRPAEIKIGEASTGKEGRFRFELPSGQGAVPTKVRYDGNQAFRGSIFEVGER